MDVAQLLEQFIHPRRYLFKPAEQALLEQAERLNITVANEQLAVWHWPVAKPQGRIMVLHGWESHSAHWASFIPQLYDVGYSVYAFDAPAHGASSGEHSNVLAMGKAFVQVVATIGAIDGIIGHSGGSAAALYGFAHGVTVQASVHLSSPASLGRVLQQTAQAAQLDLAQQAQFCQAFADYLGTSPDIMSVQQLEHGLIHPGLIWHDPADREVPYSEAEALLAYWPLAQLRQAHGLGHRRILRDPQVIAQSVAFLQQQLAPKQRS